MHAISFLIVALCIFKFNVSLVTARPLERGSRLVAILEGLNTNAKRFAAGLPPLPPVRRLVGSKVDSASSQLNTSSYYNCSFPAARRQTPSFIPYDSRLSLSLAFCLTGSRSHTAKSERLKSEMPAARALGGLAKNSIMDSK